MPAIEVIGLRKSYRAGRGRRVDALAGIDFEVPAGGVFAFVGPNGAGKTTTIRCLLALARPSGGRCAVLGADPRDRFAEVQHRIGSLIEGEGFPAAFSGRRNLDDLARIGRLGQRRVEAVLDIVGLMDRADDAVHTYSHGMRQRLGIAAALLKDPELLILDEPANGLDPDGIVEMRRLLRQLGDEGRTVFVSSHQLADIQLIADHVAVLAAGRCVASGQLDGVLASVSATGVVVRVVDAQAAAAALVAAGFEAWIDDEGTVRVASAVRAAPEIARALAAADIFPLELRPAGATLEEAYLALTRRAREQP